MNHDAGASGAWFEAGVPALQPPDDRLPGLKKPSMLAGALAGALGGLAALAVSDGAVDRARLMDHVHIALGDVVPAASLRPFAVRAVVVVAVVLGALGGAGIGRLTRRLVPLVGRLVFCAIFVPAVWTALYTFVLMRSSPALISHVAFIPSVLGALAYGVFVAFGRSRAGREPPTFPLVRRRAA